MGVRNQRWDESLNEFCVKNRGWASGRMGVEVKVDSRKAFGVMVRQRRMRGAPWERGRPARNERL
jgi:hypothetical protein